MVKKNEYPKKTEFSKANGQASEAPASNYPQKTGEFHRKENNVRNSRPARETQQRDNNQQKEYQRRETPKRENTTRDNQQIKENNPRETAQREKASRDNTTRDTHQKNYHRENTANRDGFRESREPYRQHNQRPTIKPQTEENLEDITADIGRIQKEIELELKEIRSLRLGI